MALDPDPARLAAGWERRFVADPERAKEAIELYRALGYEACADPVQPDALRSGCDGCILASRMQLKTIYTRQRRP